MKFSKTTNLGFLNSLQLTTPILQYLRRLTLIGDINNETIDRSKVTCYIDNEQVDCDTWGGTLNDN